MRRGYLREHVGERIVLWYAGVWTYDGVGI